MHEPKNAILTGAASGLGRALSVRLARDGWRLALADIDEAGLSETLRQVRSAGGEAQSEPLDVGAPDQWQSLHDRLRKQWTRLDLLVNNAGVCGTGDVGDFPLSDWQWLLQVNLYGTIQGCHTMVPWLKENPRGAHILNTASIAGLVAAPAMAAYNVSKAGVIALSETLYAELRPHGVGVTVLCPGFFPSNLLSRGRFRRERELRAAEELVQDSRLTAERLAERAVRAIGRKRLYVVEGRRARWFWRYKRFLPALFHRLLSATFHHWNPE